MMKRMKNKMDFRKFRIFFVTKQNANYFTNFTTAIANGCYLLYFFFKTKTEKKITSKSQIS